MQLGATLLMVQWSTGWVRAAVKGAVRGPGGRCIPCTTARHWVALHFSHCVEPCTHGCRTAEGDPSELQRKGAARSRWLGVCGRQRALGKGGQRLGGGRWSPMPTRT